LQSRLLEEEAQKFINYRFNKTTVRNLTGLQGEQLERFMEMYRPNYEFTAYSTEYEFYQYILDASKRFRRGLLPPSINRND
jgi:ferritin-like protein